MYNACTVDDSSIALTFDDGPTPESTTRLLEILREEGVPATLFFIGKRVAEHPELTKQAADEGHEIGNHSWSHPYLTKLSANEVANELTQTTEAIAAAIGQRPALFRPPYIDTNEALNERVPREFGMKVIGLDVDSKDWRDHDADRTIQHVMEKAAAGSIILCHETQPTTLEALPEMIRQLKAKGFRLVTVSELMAADRS